MSGCSESWIIWQPFGTFCYFLIPLANENDVIY